MSRNPSVYDESAYNAYLGTAGIAGTQLWSIWTFVWRPIRGRWCLVVNSADARPWTAEELAMDPVLAMTFRPFTMAVGPLYLAMDMARQLPPPFIDTLKESPFWNGERVR
ncbi:hypothetical protein [Nocardia phage NS-I]|nr:hypothetical protein [Nocardia phage NS-I]